MLTVVLVGKIKSSRAEEFESLFKELIVKIQAEAGCRGATWGQTEIAGEYALVERYDDQQALLDHRASPHMAEFGPKLSDLFDGTPVITRFVEKCAL